MYKIIFVLSFIFYTVHVNAQNWQTFTSKSVKYFQTSSNYIYGLRFDSTETTLNGDSIYCSYKTLRLETSDNCNYGIAPAWFGDKVIVKTNGDNCFFNGNGEIILIRTNTNIGDSYKLFEYNNGDSIIANHLSSNQEIVLGVPDSVKTFQITSNSPNFEFNNQTIKLSKNNGLLTALPFYSFPASYNGSALFGSVTIWPNILVGQDSPKLGITKPTFKDIYDFEIGDVLQMKNVYFTQLTVINKIMLPNDSVRYKFLRQTHQIVGTPTIATDTVIASYNISENYRMDLMPEEFNYSNYLGTGKLLEKIYYDNNCGFREYTRVYTPKIYPTDSAEQCFYDWHCAITDRVSFSHAGSFYYRYINPYYPSYEHSVGHVSNTHLGATCGEKVYLGLDEPAFVEPLTIYPNPTSADFYIETDLQITVIEIYDLMGSKVLEANQPKIDLSSLSNGTYLLIIRSDKASIHRKIVKLK